MDTTFTSPSNLSPGLYPSMTQGHAQLVGETGSTGEVQCLVVLNMGGLVDIGGVHVDDPEVLRRLGDHLHMLAGRLRHQLEHPYNPGRPGIVGCPDCVGR